MIIRKPLEERILVEDNHLIGINKNAGELSQPDYTKNESLIESIKTHLKIKYQKPGNVFLGSIHRLDRPVSGAMIFAKTSKALERMHKLFQSKQIGKTYLALVDNAPKQEKGILQNYLIKNSRQNISYVVNKNREGAKKAILEYELVGVFQKKFLLKIKLKTGRHHQIRVQLKNIGCHIVGDLKYGYPRPNYDKSICLHCYKIDFVHPIKKSPVVIKAPIPKIQEWQNVHLSID